MVDGEEKAGRGDPGAGGDEDVLDRRDLVVGRAADLAHTLGDAVHAVKVGLPELTAVGVERNHAVAGDGLIYPGLVLTTNKAAIAWSVPAVLVAIAYPFTKRIISMPQAVLGIAFNFGIVIAFAAVQGSVPAVAWWMWLGNLFWVLAYDTEYAMVDRDDDLKIGIKTSAITLGRWDVPAIVAFYLLFLSIWALALYPYALNAIFYIAIAVALAQVLWHFTLIRTRSREGCFKAFRVNHWLGATVFAGIAGSYLLRWLGLTG